MTKRSVKPGSDWIFSLRALSATVAVAGAYVAWIYGGDRGLVAALVAGVAAGWTGFGGSLCILAASAWGGPGAAAVAGALLAVHYMRWQPGQVALIAAAGLLVSRYPAEPSQAWLFDLKGLYFCALGAILGHGAGILASLALVLEGKSFMLAADFRPRGRLYGPESVPGSLEMLKKAGFKPAGRPGTFSSSAASHSVTRHAGTRAAAAGGQSGKKKT